MFHVNNNIVNKNPDIALVRGHIYKTWTGVHGPPHGPGPWTTTNFQKEIAPTGGQGMRNIVSYPGFSYLLLTSLRACLVKAGGFGIAAP